MKPTKYSSALLALILSASSTSAAIIYSESFDYGGTTAALTSVSTWTSSSALNLYDHDGGLSVSGVNGETGGAWFADRPGGNLAASLNTTTIDLSTISAGGTIWAGAIFDYKAGTSHSLSFNGGTVSGLGFSINSTGDISLTASNGGATVSNDTGIDTIAGTYFLLLRATKGAGASPTDSVVDFWFNPSDTSSVGALGAAGYSTGNDSRWGRDTQTMSGITGTLSSGGITDEIRLGNELVDVVGIPEPSTALLGGLGLGLLALLRRRSY